MFKTNVSGSKIILGAKFAGHKKVGSLPPNAPPWLRACDRKDAVLLHFCVYTKSRRHLSTLDNADAHSSMKFP